MSTYTLTLVDVRRIQPYLFTANELKQCLGGSVLVELATHDWIVEALPLKRNVEMNGYAVEFSEQTIADRDAEAIFLGGGNAAILFQTRKLALDFARAYTRKVLTDAPGLDVAVAHTDFDWDKHGSLQEAWDELRIKAMPRQKEGRAVSQPRMGLSVTAECAFTGLPAVDEVPNLDDSERGVLVSAEAGAKHDFMTIDEAKKRIAKLMPLEKYDYPDKFDSLGGEKGRSSYIAVVHIDGNSIGKRIQKHCADQDNREMLKKMRKFSEAINEISEQAMGKTVAWLETKIEKEHIYDQWYTEDGILLHDQKFPVRPIIYGGDDLTFVCEGRLGLALAKKFLDELKQILLDDGQPVYACAGVAIVSSSYPFSRAYHLAEELTRESKKTAHKYDEYQSAVSLIHWHVSTSGLTRDWDDIKTREFQDGKLLLRPLVVNARSEARIENWRTWDVLMKQVDFFRDETKWKFGRNKLKELREILREKKVQRFTTLYGDLPDTGIAGLEEARKTGWHGGRCVYFDALEVDDLFISPKEA